VVGSVGLGDRFWQASTVGLYFFTTATKKKKKHKKKKKKKKINAQINKSPKFGEISPDPVRSHLLEPPKTINPMRSHQIRRGFARSPDPVRSHLIWNHQKLVTTISFIVTVKEKASVMLLRVRKGERESR
jgi:hypothetical protein